MNDRTQTADGQPDAMEPIDAQAQAWVRRLRGGRVTTRDAEVFHLWRRQSPAHARAWAQASQEWLAIGRVAQAYRAGHPASTRMMASRPDRRAFFGLAFSGAGALAVMAVVRPPLGLWPSWSEMQADYRTTTGEQRDVELAGQVRLVLNTQTSVAVLPGPQMARVELIVGELAVQSRHDAMVEVAAGQGLVRLAAGSVEMRRYHGDRVRVLCVQGSAELQHPQQTIRLQANQQLIYGPLQVQRPVQVDPADSSNWRRGMVAFQDTPLTEVVEEINRYRPGRVVVLNDALAQYRLSGRFRIDALDEAIVQIQALADAKVRKIGDMVLLS